MFYVGKTWLKDFDENVFAVNRCCVFRYYLSRDYSLERRTFLSSKEEL